MHFNITSFGIAIVSFLVLMWLISKYAFGPLMGIMEQRRQLVKDQLDSAESNRKQADALLAEQKAALEQVRSEAKQMMEQARVTSSKQAEDIIQQAKEEASRLKQDALRDIETEKNKAVAALRSQVSAMSVLIASKIIEKQIDEKSQEQLVEQYLKEVGGNQ
ncbi:F0F1 ATP synthase subunit B [Paenibacillus sp. GD4]|jgi:F-type H+-transporting ATPase subunit b|uniref:F0F1 ATP synthase subunit B n=1 Tax=Paenibacillus TaxID=44249 RepID=UPI002542C241|nr:MULTISPECIES: F0F1 ATP synthase subunit B [Paenibacillus]MDQ1911228.1 F0F1 ATP synthase subunit B [Paenibacillus sp. GD4]